MRMDGPFTATASGLGIRVHARPGARRDAVEGLRAEADGSVALRVAVRAAPQDGKANAAIAKLLAGCALRPGLRPGASFLSSKASRRLCGPGSKDG